MWRSRARLGLGVIVVALLWSAAPAAAPVASATTADVGTLQVSPGTVQASQETPLVFTFTAPASLAQAQALVVTMSMPTDWTALPPSSSDLACPNSGCSLVASSSTRFAVELALKPGTTFTLNVQATPPAYAGSASFTASVETRGGPYVTGDVTAPVTVICPADGLGTMSVDPSTAPAGSSMTFTFAYTAGSCGAGAGGVIAVTVPQGWTPPNAAPGTAGFATWAGSPSVSVSGSTIIVPVGNLEPGTMISFEYETAQSPRSPGSYPFAASQSGAGGPPQQLASPPAVMVTPVQATATPTQGITTSPPPPARGTGTMTVTPSQVTASRPSTLRLTYTAAEAGLPSSGEVTVLVPAGWTAPSRSPGQAGYVSASRGQLTVSGRQIMVTDVTLRHGQQLTITYAAGTAPGTAGVATFLTSEGPDGRATLAALDVSPSVNVAVPGGAHGQPTDWLPIAVLVIGLILAAGTAGRLAFRRLRPGGQRQDGHETATADVRTVPHTGPPTTVVIRDTGRRPALTVRIEPHASAAVTTIEETRP